MCATGSKWASRETHSSGALFTEALYVGRWYWYFIMSLIKGSQYWVFINRVGLVQINMSVHFIMTWRNAKWLQLGVLTGLNALTESTINCIFHDWSKEWEGGKEMQRYTQELAQRQTVKRQPENNEQPRSNKKDRRGSKETQNALIQRTHNKAEKRYVSEE